MPQPSDRRVVRELEPTLCFEHVTCRHADGARQIAVLDKVSFSVRDGAFTGLFGLRRSGKSTVLRLAAGIDLPDEGAVHFAGQSLGAMSVMQRERLLRGPIALVSASEWRPLAGEVLLDHVALGLGSRGVRVSEARRRARQALERVQMGGCAERPAATLSLGERMRAMLAKALLREPRLLLVDEPALVPSLGEREQLGGLIRTLAHELGSALLVASEELSALHGAGILISISGGELCSTEESRADRGQPGVVIELPKRTAPLPPREQSPL